MHNSSIAVFLFLGLHLLVYLKNNNCRSLWFIIIGKSYLQHQCNRWMEHHSISKGGVSMIYLCIIRKLKMLELSCLFYGCQISAWQHIYGKCLIVSDFVASLHPYTRWDLVTLTDFCHFLQFPLVGQEKAFKIQNMWWVEMVLPFTLLLFPPPPLLICGSKAECFFLNQFTDNRLFEFSW